jgi:hypothetical protein
MNEQKLSQKPAPEAAARPPTITIAKAARRAFNFHVIPSIPLGFSNLNVTRF